MYAKTKLSFGILLVSNNILISEINEGVTLNKAISDAIIHFAKATFQNRPFVYLTNRVNSYAVDPIIYRDVSQLKNLRGFAVVSQTLSARNAEIERLFLNKPFEIFSDLDKAKSWALNTLKDNYAQSLSIKTK